MTTMLETTAHNGSILVRASAISAGDFGSALRAELALLLKAGDGGRRKALPLALAQLVERGGLTKTEATELGALVDLLFDSPDATDTSMARRVSAYYRKLVLDPSLSPIALAVVSVINSFYAPQPANSGSPQGPVVAAV